MTASITIPAYAADTLGETVTLRAPEDWHERIKALGPRCCYGPNYNRTIFTLLKDMSRQVEQGYSVLAYDTLLAAESVAKR